MRNVRFFVGGGLKSMEVKVCYSYWSPKDLESKINTFIRLTQDKIDIINIKMSNSFGTYVAMIIYEQKKADSE